MDAGGLSTAEHWAALASETSALKTKGPVLGGRVKHFNWPCEPLIARLSGWPSTGEAARANEAVLPGASTTFEITLHPMKPGPCDGPQSVAVTVADELLIKSKRGPACALRLDAAPHAAKIPTAMVPDAA